MLSMCSYNNLQIYKTSAIVHDTSMPSYQSGFNLPFLLLQSYY